MDKLISTDNGGMPFVLDDLRWVLGQSASDAGIYYALQDFLRAFGENFIVQGCANTGIGSTMAEGWVLLAGELLKVDSHTITNTYFQKAITYDATGNKSFQNGSTVDTYQKNRAVCTSVTGTLAYNGTTYAQAITSSITAATTIVSGILKLATSAEVIAGIEALKAVTPATLQSKVASTSVKGITRYATNAETLAGLDDTIAVTPSGLESRQASASDTGLIMLSTNAEVQIGIDTAKAVTPAGLASRTATTARTGVQANATDVEAKALTSTSKTITPSTLSSVTGGLLFKVIEIGDWDMYTNNYKLVAHGLTDYTKYRGTISVVIRDDIDYNRLLLNSDPATTGYTTGIYSGDTTKIYLSRINSGIFDSADFNSTSFNRGWITIAYSI